MNNNAHPKDQGTKDGNDVPTTSNSCKTSSGQRRRRYAYPKGQGRPAPSDAMHGMMEANVKTAQAQAVAWSAALAHSKREDKKR